MNHKNPFVPAPSYQQPPLPPGPPPPSQPGQPDYSAYWAAQQAQPQHPSIGNFNQQWTAPQPPRPPADQSALYANYGYGNQNHWRQQNQQQQHPPPQFHPQPPPAPVPPPAQPGYSPYQPAAGYSQPYVPQAQPMAAPYVHPQPPQTPQQQQFFPHPPPQHLPQHHAPMQMQQQPRHNVHHTPPQHMPPAKRPRVDGPNHNPNQRGPPSQPQFQPPTGPMQHSGPFGGPSRGGGSGGNHGPMGGGNRGGMQGGGRGGSNMGGRGGRGGGSMGGNRGGGMSGQRGRGGSFSGGPATGPRGGGSSGSMRGHGSRGNFGGNKDYHNRRGGGSFGGGGGGGGSGGSFQHMSGSFRGRGQSHSNRGRNDGGGNSSFASRDGAANSNFNSGKKDENRRTLTDFKIVGLEIRELAWTWGVLPSPSVKTEPKEVSLAAVADESTQQGDIAEDGVKPVPADEADANASTSSTAAEVKAAASVADIPVGPRATSDAGPPPSRMRIYFHTPVTAVDSHPIPHNGSFSLGATPSDSRKGKRKKIESDDGDFEEGRGPPPPPGMHDDRSSVAASVAPSATEASEGDWLMAAIAGEAENETHGQEGGEDDNIHPDFDGAVEGGGETGTDGGAGIDTAEAPAHDADTESYGAHNGPDAEPEPAPPEGHSTSFSSDSMDGYGPMPYTNGHDVAAIDNVSGSSASDASQSTLVSSPPLSTAPEAVSSAAPSEAAESLRDRSKTPVPATQPALGDKASLTLSTAATLLSIDAPIVTSPLSGEPTVIVPETDHDAEQTHTQDFVATQVDEPPPSLPVSATSTTYGDAYAPVNPEPKGPKIPAANRLSISYEGGNRRMVFDAEVVDSITLFRREARAEVRLALSSDGDGDFKGILMETLSDVTKSYHAIQSTADSHDFPPFSQAHTPLTLTLIVHLDTVRPLSEPKWVKTGDIPEWLKSLFGRMFWFAGDAAESWEKKIVVSDPDPPPTLTTVLEGWSTGSSAGTLTERQRFLKTHLAETDNILEILLRLVRGDRTAPLALSMQSSTPALTGPLLSALTAGSAHAAQQTPVSLAVLAIFRMAVQYAEKSSGEKGKAEVEDRVGEIIRCLPQSQIHKTLDAIFKEWKVEKKSR